MAGSCADKAGVKKGDIITALGDNMIQSYTDLVAALKQFKAGDKTTLAVYRDGEKVVLDIIFDERTPEAAAAATAPETEGSDEGSSQGWTFP